MSGAPLSSVLVPFVEAHANFHRDIRSYISGLSDDALAELIEAAEFVEGEARQEYHRRLRDEKTGRRR